MPDAHDGGDVEAVYGHGDVAQEVSSKHKQEDSDDEEPGARVVPERARTITFDPSMEKRQTDDETLYIPSPRERERGMYPQLSSILLPA